MTTPAGLIGLSAPSIVSRQFETLIVQPATLCNLDCGYCYLPGRREQKLMPIRVAERITESIEEQGASHVVDVVWHGGEPLTTPIAHMRRLLAPFETMRRSGQIMHVVQTNATLIDEQWLALFGEFEFQMGISIDGPEQLNGVRLDWAGHSTVAKVMRGVQGLRSAGMPFSVICVVTAETVEHVDELIHFFGHLGCESVAFNIEEMEGLNAHRTLVTAEQARRFWARLWELQPVFPDLRIRDLDQLRGYLSHTRSGQPYREPRYDPIPTVSTIGEVVVLSPELLGVKSPEYRDFVIGNVLTQSLPKLLADMGNAAYVVEFERGLAACAASCESWDFCRGAQAANRFFEHGSFHVTETAYCQNTRQAVVLSALDRIAR